IRWLEWACYRSAKSVLFLNEYSRRRFLDYYPFKKPRMRVIPGGVDIEKFKPVTEEGGTDALRKQLGLPEDRMVLLTVRRLEARMGLDNLIAAVAEISNRSPECNFLLLIAGKGSLAEKLQSQATLLGLDDRVRFLGFVSDDQLPSYYNAADLFIMPSTSIEGFGLATAEALSAGLPVLGTPVGGTTEILQSIDPWLLFRHASVEAMADKIEEVIRDPRLILALKSRCRDEAVSRYSWEMVTEHVEQEFEMIWKNR
ncbi:MAG: glycosyltransferase family 4 protein, partial [Nitrospinae bacterium]|nr:glycosyltransferase family 4 protein [Nitrospinota bacterium]